MADEHVLLLSMPWEQLEYPSIQLGLLLSVLERAGIPAQARSLNLDFMEHCVTATAGLPVEERLSVSSYHEVVVWSRDVSIGDWIFVAAPPPFRSADADEPYINYLHAAGMPERAISSALRFRTLVPSFLERVADEIAASRPAIVGFTTAFNQTLASLALASQLRARLGDRVRIVFGGANCQGEMGVALHRTFPVIDVVVRGEGERVLPDIALELLARGTVRPHPGLCYRNPGDPSRQVVIAEQPGSVSLDDVPTPNYDEYFERLGRASFSAELQGEVTLFYESARGCWWGEKSHCAFCGISDLSMSFRAKSPERIVAELGELAQRYGRLDFLFVDYILHRRYFEELLPRLRDAGFDFKIFCETKANLRRDQVRLLPEAGFTVIQAGVESLSTPILRLMRKGVTALQNLRLLKWCAEYGVRLYWNVLYGIPGESSEEYTAMADLVPSLTHLEPPRLVPLQLDRFSPYFERPTESGIVPLGPRRDFRFVYPADRVDDATLAEIAYSFEFRHADGRDPETYTASFQRAIRAWQAAGRRAIGTLRYRRGPGFLVVTDRRPGFDSAEYQLDGPEAQIYLACEDGATAADAWNAARACDGGAQLSVEEVRKFLDELVGSRLACMVDGRYLSLALPAAPRTAPEPVRGLEAASAPGTFHKAEALVVAAAQQ